MPNVYVKPGRDTAGQPFIIRDPHRGYAIMPSEGGWVPQDEFWMRRLRDGDAVLADPPVNAEAASAADELKPEPRRKRG